MKNQQKINPGKVAISERTCIGTCAPIDTPKPGIFVMGLSEETKKKIGKANSTHGMSKTKIYRMWKDMNKRCYNKNTKDFAIYGAIGIIVCDEWKNDFVLFRDYMMSLPHAMEKGHTLDRIDSGGNYEPGNVRWANLHVQAANRKFRKSKYTGVCYHKRDNVWSAKITVNYKQIHIGNFTNEKAAYLARQKYIIDNKLFEYKI